MPHRLGGDRRQSGVVDGLAPHRDDGESEQRRRLISSLRRTHQQRSGDGSDDRTSDSAPCQDVGALSQRWRRHGVNGPSGDVQRQALARLVRVGENGNEAAAAATDGSIVATVPAPWRSANSPIQEATARATSPGGRSRPGDDKVWSRMPGCADTSTGVSRTSSSSPRRSRPSSGSRANRVVESTFTTKRRPDTSSHRSTTPPLEISATQLILRTHVRVDKSLLHAYMGAARTSTTSLSRLLTIIEPGRLTIGAILG